MGFAEAKLVSYTRFSLSLNFQFVFWGVSALWRMPSLVYILARSPPFSTLHSPRPLLPPPEKLKRTHSVFPRNFPRTHDAAFAFSPDW